MSSTWPGGYIASLDFRAVTQPKPGRATAWVTSSLDLVAGQTASPLATYLSRVDTANGIAVRQSPTEWMFPNDFEPRVGFSAVRREGITLEEWAGRLNVYYRHLEMLLSPQLFVIGGAAAHVFDDDDESTSGAFEAEINVVVLVIGRALQEDGKLAVGGGAINVGFQFYAVAHGYGGVALVGDGVLVGGMGGS